jgi:hypothetical protein
LRPGNELRTGSEQAPLLQRRIDVFAGAFHVILKKAARWATARDAMIPIATRTCRVPSEGQSCQTHHLEITLRRPGSRAK